MLAEDPHGDVATPLVDPNTGRVDAYSVDDLRRTWVALDADLSLPRVSSQ